jgi:hypothetical protein
MTIVKFLRNLPQDILYYIIICTVWVINLFSTGARKAAPGKQQSKPDGDEIMIGSMG